VGVSAECLLALVNGDTPDDEEAKVKRFVAAALIVEAMLNLKMIRKSLTSKK
jgi:hypothetical protein